MAQAGYTSKGIVYVLLGVIGFMAAFELGGQSTDRATPSGSLRMIKDFPLGTVLLVVLALGLLCYSAWRALQAFGADGYKNKDWKKRLRYSASGLAYLGLCFTAFKLATGSGGGDQDRNREAASQLMEASFGQVLVGLCALVFAVVGLYQIYYGLSEKYRKHVNELSLHSQAESYLLLSGKVGFVSRGVVWLAIGVLFVRAALKASASEAGDTGKAFRFIESNPMGSYLLAMLALGLLCYGVFNFIRARYEHFVR